MSLDIPHLDDREYEELLEDARKRLSVHAEEWSDHNVHDPGITVLEMLTWLAETYIYQLDQVTDAHRRKHLKLLGVEPRPPTPASVSLQLSSGDPDADEIPADRQGEEIEEGEKVIVDDGDGFTGTFETTKPVTLTRASVERVVTHHPNGEFTDNTTANETYGMSFLAFGARAPRGSVMYLGFDRDPFAAAREDIIDVTVDFDDADLPEVVPHEEDDPAFRPSVGIAWQYCTDYENWTNDDVWGDFGVRRDQTNQLYRGGTVALEKTDEWLGETKASLMLTDDSDGGPRLEVREGTDDAPDQTPEFVWIRCKVLKSGYEIPPPLNSVRLDIVPAQHRSSVGTENEEDAENGVLSRPDGGTVTTAGPGQTFEFEESPILDAEITVGGEPWEEVADFDASGPDDRHYVIDSAEGAISFGNGVRGKAPAAGQTVVAEQYVHGGGERGNVPRSASCEFESEELTDIPVSLWDSGEGGTDPEPIESAVARLRTDLTTPYRAVSLDDYCELATMTPGVRLGRVTAAIGRGDANANPAGHDEIRVVVVPYSPLEKPQPSDGFLEAVQQHLEKHRLLTDRVRVEPPTYVGISVETRIRIAPGYSESGRRAATEAALDEFLEPLGATGEDGWPFGRPVYKSEIYEVIANVEGIESVLEVSLLAGDVGDRNHQGNVLMDDAALPYPENYAVIVERDSPGGGL